MNILILSRNPALYSTDSLVRACRRRRHKVRVVDHMHCDLVIENGKLEVIYQGLRIRNIDAIIPRIGTSATSHGAAVIRQFQGQGVFSSLDPNALLLARDKVSCLQALAVAKIPVPKTALSNNYESLKSISRELGQPPFVIKLVQGTHGLGVILSESYRNAESILEAFYKSKQKVMVQEFIEEAKGADVRVFIVDGEIVGSMKRQAKAGEFRSNLHRGASASLITLSETEKEVAIRAAEVMGLSIAGVDMLQTSAGPLILEVNASPGLEGIETTTRVSISDKIIEYVEKNYRK